MYIYMCMYYLYLFVSKKSVTIIALFILVAFVERSARIRMITTTQLGHSYSQEAFLFLLGQMFSGHQGMFPRACFPRKKLR